MKRVRVKESLAGEGWTAAKGQEIDLPDAVAADLLRSKLAEEVSQAAPARVENREKAMRPPHDEKRKGSNTSSGDGKRPG